MNPVTLITFQGRRKIVKSMYILGSFCVVVLLIVRSIRGKIPALWILFINSCWALILPTNKYGPKGRTKQKRSMNMAVTEFAPSPSVSRSRFVGSSPNFHATCSGAFCTFGGSSGVVRKILWRGFSLSKKGKKRKRQQRNFAFLGI